MASVKRFVFDGVPVSRGMDNKNRVTGGEQVVRPVPNGFLAEAKRFGYCCCRDATPKTKP